ncbi:MAG: efflux RND transporter permease subunit [Thermodesulfobacteriota bacterium]
MLLSDLSVKRPVTAAVMMLALVTLGFFSYRRLAIDMWPDVEIPVLSIVTIYPGASPEAVEKEVTNIIEEAVNPIAGVKHVGSVSKEGVSQVVVEFQLEVKINEASQEARAKINAIRGDLPLDAEEPIIQKLDFAATPIISLTVHSDTLGPRDITTLVEKKIKRRLENISGVGKVDLIGPSTREVNIEIDPTRTEALGIGVDEVIDGLRKENVNTPLGRLNQGGSELPMRISGKPEQVEQFKTMVITKRNNRPITLADVAEVQDGIEEQRSMALINGVPTVALDILKQSRANTVQVVDAVKKEVEKLQQDLPRGTRIEIVRDGSIFIRDSVKDVEETLVIGGLLTILIVFFFLNSWRSTVITGLTLPISVISSFIIMNFMGMTLNFMTLMALSLAIGLLIDDAIVVRENIVRHLEKGKDHFTAAREGTSEIGLAVLATTFSIVAVFVPVAFMKGIVGRFFFQFGITITFAVLISLFVSFTLDPMLSSRWYDPDVERRNGRRHLVARILDRFNAGFDWIAEQYKFVIGWALDHRKTISAMAVVAFVGGLAVFGSLQQEFISPSDQGEFVINVKTAPDASIAETRNRADVILAALKQIPEIQLVYASIGAGEASTVRDLNYYIKLTERKNRTRRQEAVMEQARAFLDDIPGIQASFLEAGRLDDRKPLLVSIRGEDLGLLKQYARELKTKMYDIPGIVDLEMTLEQEIPEYRLVVDRERAMDVGVDTEDVVTTLGALVGGKTVSTYDDEDGDAVDVKVRLPGGLREDIDQIRNLRLSVPQAQGIPELVTLDDIIEYQISTTPSEINRRDLRREVVLSANLDKVPLGTVVENVKKEVAAIQMAPGYKVTFSGEAEDMVESFGYLAEALLLAIIFVYLILAAQFESFIDPLAIMLSLPLSILGMAGMLYFTGDTINIMSLIGLIMLMGLVTKNAILLVDFAKVLQKRGLPRRDALIEAGHLRLRPIMMTTLAMIFGMLPVAMALGSGSEFRAPMGRAVIGGLITSTLLTLLVVPVIYTLLDDVGAFVRARFSGHKEAIQ